MTFLLPMESNIILICPEWLKLCGKCLWVFSVINSSVSTEYLWLFHFTGMANQLDTSRWWFNCACVCEWVSPSLCVSESVRRHVAILLGAWWMADYETLHVCRVPWCQQCVKFWWWPSDVLQYYLRCFTDMTLHSRGGCYATTRKLQQYGRPYQPKHSPSFPTKDFPLLSGNKVRNGKLAQNRISLIRKHHTGTYKVGVHWRYITELQFFVNLYR